MLRYDGKKVTEQRELAQDAVSASSPAARITTGEVYALDFIGGGIHQSGRQLPPAADAPTFPRKLSETGLFASTKDLKPAPGLIPYSVNAELWSDGAVKERYPRHPRRRARSSTTTVDYPQPAPVRRPGWRFPDGTVLVKTFSWTWSPATRPAGAGWKRACCTLQRCRGTEEVGDQVWTATPTSGTTSRPTPNCSTPKGLDRKFTIKDAKAPAASASRPGTSPAGPSAPCATR